MISKLPNHLSNTKPNNLDIKKYQVAVNDPILKFDYDALKSNYKENFTKSQKSFWELLQQLYRLQQRVIMHLSLVVMINSLAS